MKAGTTAVAARYARALLDVARTQGDPAAVKVDLD
jgi:F0F1-type ATP synthase delta subunit